MTKNREGITLIALVITIIVLLILAGVSIAMLTGQSGVLTQAERAKIASELSGYKEQLNIYVAFKKLNDQNFDEKTLTANKTTLYYNSQEVTEKGSIKTIIPNITDQYLEKLEVIKGDLLIKTKNITEITIAQSLGIEVNPYEIVNGELLSSDGNLLLVDSEGALTIPGSVTKIGEGAFANVSGLRTITIPGTVKEIADNAFSNNPTLENVIMQEGTEKIGNSAFASCINLKNINFPSTIISMGGMCFYNCKSLTDVVLPKNLKNLYSMSFSDCNKLKNVVLNEGLVSIQNNVFAKTAFSSISIPASVTSIGENVFVENVNLETINLTENKSFIYESGMLMPTTRERIIFISDKYLRGITSFSIPNGIANFSLNLQNYSNITEVIIPRTVVNINFSILPISIANVRIDSANSKFNVSEAEKIVYTKDTKELISCYSKETNIELDINGEIGITKLAENSFYHANNARIISIGPTITNIEKGVFTNCKNIQTINLGENISHIDGAFKVSNYSGSVNINPKNNYYTVENDVLYNKAKTELVAVLNEISGNFVMDNFVETIGESAFYNQKKLSTISVSSKLKNIKKLAFSNCTNLTSIDIPNTIETIANDAFSQCINLNKITINKKTNSVLNAPWGATKGMKVVIWNG